MMVPPRSKHTPSRFEQDRDAPQAAVCYAVTVWRPPTAARRAMKIALRVEGEITEDGHLLVALPPELPRGRVVVTLEMLPEEDLDLTEEDLRGAGLTAQEI